MSMDRRAVIAASFVVTCAPAFAATGRVFTPEQFGARGDGRTNDTTAFARLSAAVNRNGGGIISLRRTTYLVGDQAPTTNDPYMFRPSELLKLVGCTAPLAIRGNGARLRCASGLRYGVFGPGGEPAHPPMPYVGPGLASPYFAMIWVENCSGSVSVSDLDLEGPGELIVGGQYGDTGWQIPATGLILKNNRGSETIERLRSYRHPQDGLMIDGVDEETPNTVRTLTDVTADANGRQGCSVVGGRGYRFARCSFTRTGRGKVSSAPGAGVDIEAEAGKRIRRISFSDCKFIDNAGCGMVADSGDSEDVRFSGCEFVGTTNWSAWPSKPLFRFEHCSFVGALVCAYGDADPARSAQFLRCTFTDDPSRSPTGMVYGGVNSDRPLADLSDSQNMLFDQCTFTALHGGVLPWSTGAIYRDCTMIQQMTKEGYPRGQYVGANRIDGKVDLYGSRISGTLIVNGQQIR